MPCAGLFLCFKMIKFGDPSVLLRYLFGISSELIRSQPNKLRPISVSFTLNNRVNDEVSSSFYTSKIRFLRNAKQAVQENFGLPFTGNIYVKDARYKLVK
mgnify:CR=1 FL=1